MTTNPAVKVLSYLTYFSILFHAIDGIVLTAQNRKARPVKYAKSKPQNNTMWSSRNMGILGTVILAFIVTHMSNFWYVVKFDSSIPMQKTGLDGEMLEEPLKDLHTVVMDFFNPNINEFALIMVIVYILGQVAIAFHLVHGFQSGFQSLGLRHPKYTPVIRTVGYIFAIVVPLAFATIPVFLYMSQL
jgi:succinate dehydrogenase / fumarate reductase cytochrome b subunit